MQRISQIDQWKEYPQRLVIAYYEDGDGQKDLPGFPWPRYNGVALKI